MTKFMNLAWLALTLMTVATAAAQTSNATAFTLIPPSGIGLGQFTNGNGDAANFSTVDNEIDSWWGLGIKGLCCSSYNGYGIVFDARSGSIFTQGNIGIGTSAPDAPLVVATGSISGNYQVGNALLVRPAGGSAYGENGTSIYLGSMTNHGPATVAGIWSALGSGGGGGVDYDGALVMGTIPAGSLSAVPLEQMRISRLGNVGIGTKTPSAKLEVNGTIKLSGAGSSITFPNGDVQSVAWNGTLCGGDYAESVDISGDRTHYEPGDVLVIDPAQPRKFLKSNEAYSTSVTGVYSTKPGVIGRRQIGEKSDQEVPMAMIGIVPIKVSTENGPIKAGDFLVTASTPGYAMKGTERERMFGAVVGKALGNLESGAGVIEAVISLQ